MGVHAKLAVFADRVSDEAWQVIYERARHVAERWRPRPLATAWRQIGDVVVAQYTPTIETRDGLNFVGDAETLATAESFVFPAKLDRRGARRAPRDSPSGVPTESSCDALVAVAQMLYGSGGGVMAPPGLCELLGPKTQGLPYHVLLVALGLLVENTLPQTAIVYGDISPDDGEQARRGLALILGEEFELPVVVNARLMRQRLSGTMGSEALEAALRDLGPPDPRREALAGDLLSRLRRLPRARVRHELEHVVPTCRDPGHLHPDTRRLLRSLLEAVRSHVVRGELLPRLEARGLASSRQSLARMTQQCGIRLTSMAWDAIETADLDELAFLHGLLCAHSTRWEVHHAIRGVLENPALRRL